MESTATPEEVRRLVDVSALERFLAEHVPGDPAPLDVRKHVAGYSNETFFVTRGPQRWVLRRPPGGELLPTSHDVLREYRVLSAVAGRGVRAPRTVVACEDPSVIGAPFYLMEYVDGVVIRDTLPPALDTPEERARIGEELVDALVEIHAVDWRACGLEGLGRPDGYLERQVRRWSRQWELTLPRTRPLPGLDEVTEWLKTHIPESPAATLVHGDYKLDNVIFATEAPARLLAVLDWEMSTIGDPLADLGWMLSNWGDTGFPDDDSTAVVLSPLRDPSSGARTREELLARYQEKTGRSLRDFQFYLLLAVWKLGAILEGLYALYLAGAASNPNSGRFEQGVPLFIERMHRIMAGDLR